MSIGYKTQVPPLNILILYNAIANNGIGTSEIRESGCERYREVVYTPTVSIELKSSAGQYADADAGRFCTSSSPKVWPLSEQFAVWQDGTRRFRKAPL